MNHPVIQTNIMPSYHFVIAENNFLKHEIEYKNAVLMEQQSTITSLREDVAKTDHDARRWQAMKKIILAQGGEKQLKTVETTLDTDIRIEGAKR